MIILPDKNIPRSKFLIPVPKKDWMTPSIAQDKNMYGEENGTIFIIRALRGTKVVWSGTFQDRDDFDIFLYGIATGNLKYDKFLWSLPIPVWNPEYNTDVTFDFVTYVYIVSTGAGTPSTWTRPYDWSNTNNSIKCVGGGGGGGSARRNTSVSIAACGGGGGGYGQVSNYTLSISGTITPTVQINVGNGVVPVLRTTSGATPGGAGGDTWFDGTSLATATVGGGGGGGGGAATGGATATASGGAGGIGKGTTAWDGGRGGNITQTSASRGASGGGGAAGPTGIPGGYGLNGGDSSSSTAAGTNGGAGDNGGGGAGGTGQTAANGGAGGNGTNIWQSATQGINAGSGGGGGAGGGAGGVAGGVIGGEGGAYGSGGGGAAGGGPTVGSNVTGGIGKSGIILIQYQAVQIFKNMPMLGM